MNERVIMLKIKEICGSHCVGTNDATSLFDKMFDGLTSGNSISLDFGGIETLTSSFLNASVGKLFGKFDYTDLEKRLQWINLDKTDQQLISLVIKNAKEHFTKNGDTRQAEDDITRKANGEE